MEIKITEHTSSRTITTEAGKPVSAELVYTISGTSHHAIAYLELYNQSSWNFERLNRQTINIEPISQDENNPAGSYWRGIVRYDTQQLPEDKYLTPKFSFDTGGGSQHISQSIDTVWRFPQDAPNFKGAIGVDNQNVNGVDIIVPNLNINVTQVFPQQMVTVDYMAHLGRLTGKVNNNWFMGFPAGEILFMGATGSDDDSADCQISFKFSVSPNRYDFYVGDIHIRAKWGWEYMWVRYVDQIDEINGCVIKVPASVHIEKVYQTANFRTLGINV